VAQGVLHSSAAKYLRSFKFLAVAAAVDAAAPMAAALPVGTERQGKKAVEFAPLLVTLN
jgi:hypothetical protein